MNQVGGDHYIKMAMQPLVLATTNGYDPSTFSVLKYVSRYKNKNGRLDLEKALHFVDLMEQHAESWPHKPVPGGRIDPRVYCVANDLDNAECIIIHSLDTWNRNPAVRAECAKHIRAAIQKLIDTYGPRN